MRTFIALLITLGILAAIGMTAYTFYENKNLEEINKIQEKDIREKDYKIQLLNAKVYNQNELIKHYQKTISQLSKENRNIRYKANNYKKYISKPTYQTKRYVNQSYKKNQTTNYSKNTYKRKKTYHRYNGYEKLNSYSKIKIRDDNRFVSNSPIYGIYKNRIVGGIQCGNNPKIYNIENECSVYAPYSMDRIYFSKSNIKDLQTFDTSTHKIECLYDQKYGIMHDCKVKIFSYKFR